MKLSGLYRLSHDVAVCITAYLGRSIGKELLQLLISRVRLAVFQLNDVGMLHVLENVTKRTEEDFCIAALIIQFGDRTIESVLTGHRQSETMHKSICATLLHPL